MDPAKKSIINSITKELFKVASTPTKERSFISSKNGISFKTKTELLEKYFFLRNYHLLLDLDEALSYMRKVILMGDKELQEASNKWLVDNDHALEVHQELRKDLPYAKIIDDVFGENITLDDEESVEIFRKCRKENMADSVGAGFLGLGKNRKKGKYESETELASEHLKKMIDSFNGFRNRIGEDYDDLDREQFMQKYNFCNLKE